jgi:hypothetical protein
VPHPYQLTSRLDLQELGAVLPRRRLKPRTYVLPIGHSLLLGGLARVDAVAGPSANLYVTVFVSDEVVTHMGKTEGVDERRERHVGGRLSPPFTAERLRELRLVPRVAVVEGDSWRQHCRDIAIAGACVLCVLWCGRDARTWEVELPPPSRRVRSDTVAPPLLTPQHRPGLGVCGRVGQRGAQGLGARGCDGHTA